MGQGREGRGWGRGEREDSGVGERGKTVGQGEWCRGEREDIGVGERVRKGRLGEMGSGVEGEWRRERGEKG